MTCSKVMPYFLYTRVTAVHLSFEMLFLVQTRCIYASFYSESWTTGYFHSKKRTFNSTNNDYTSTVPRKLKGDTLMDTISDMDNTFLALSNNRGNVFVFINNMLMSFTKKI